MTVNCNFCVGELVILVYYTRQIKREGGVGLRSRGVNRDGQNVREYSGYAVKHQSNNCVIRACGFALCVCVCVELLEGASLLQMFGF